MRFSLSTATTAVLACASVANAASWSFTDASVIIKTKGSAVDGASREKFNPTSPLSSAVTLGPADTLSVSLTVTEDDNGKRPHQAFLTLQEPATGLEESYVVAVKESGKGKVEVTHKDLPNQLLTTDKPLKASLVIGSFGSSTPSNTFAFNVFVRRDPTSSQPATDKPLRYGKLAEINHIFKADPQSPPMIITLVFSGLALITIPALLGGWLALGANVDHLSQAMSNAPVAHALFLGSILGMEGIFFMYYSSWTLFQTLPPATVAAIVAVLSGSRALGEVQGRRLAGKR